MIPILYDKTEKKQIGLLSDAIKCEVLEERNGEFELTLIYPSTSELLGGLEKENIIVADANDYLKAQKFRIYMTRKLMSNRVEISARHISFDLAHDWIDEISINNQSCEYVLNTLFRNSQFSSHYRGYSNIVMTANYAMNKANIIEAIGGKSGSIIDTFGNGAEILRDNTEISVLNSRGHDNEVSIEYRKNLTGLEVEEDTTDLVTRIKPYAEISTATGDEISVKGDFVDSPLINNYAHPYVKFIDYSSEFDEENQPTKEKLEAFARKDYSVNKVDIPKMNYKIQFVPLSKCAGYEELEDRINLCDTVTIRDTRYNIDTQAKVIKVIYNVLRDRYESMELGEPKTTLGDVIGGSNEAIQGPPGPQGPQGPAGADGSIGDFPNTLPPNPVITAKLYGFASIELTWTFKNKVYYSYELYASKTKGFVPNTFNLLFSGQASTFLHQVKPTETWYYRVCAINSHGQRTEFSPECEVKTIKINDLSDYVESASIGDALIGTLSLDRGWVGQLHGNWIDARQLSVTDGNGKRTLDIDSFGNVNLDVANLKINSTGINDYTREISMSVSNETVNNLQIGGANLLLNSDERKQLDRAVDVAFNEIAYAIVDTHSDLVLTQDTSFVLSFMVERVGNTEFECFDTITFDNGWNHRWSRADIDQIIHIKGSAYKFIMKPKTIPKGVSIASKISFIAEYQYGGGVFYNVMLSEGNKATAWSPANQDVKSSIAKIDIKTNEITASVNSSISAIDGKINSAQSQINQQADQIAHKVDVNGVKSTITQSAYEVNFAFNEYSRWDGSSGTSGRIWFNEYGIHTQASDGSYSTIGGGKMQHYIAGANYKYYSLIHVETIRLYNEWGIIDGYFGVPYRYQGLNFNVIASISYVGFDRSVAHAFKNLNISVSEINPSNCTYRLQVTPIGVDVQGAYTVNASKVECVVTIIA